MLPQWLQVAKAARVPRAYCATFHGADDVGISPVGVPINHITPKLFDMRRRRVLRSAGAVRKKAIAQFDCCWQW